MDNIHMEKEYKFSISEIEDIWYIYMVLSDSTFSTPEVSIGSKGRYILSCETMMSAMNTIVSIDSCCGRGAYSDAFTLIRKVRDDLMQYLFLLNVIQNVQKFSDEINEISLDDLVSNQDRVLQIIEHDIQVMTAGDRKIDADFAMESWMYNELEKECSTKYRKEFFDTSKYRKYLMSKNDNIKYIIDNFLCMLWKDVDRKLNNYVHGNGIKYITDNYVIHFDKEKREKELVQIIENITSIFLSILSLIDSTKMHSSDYLDAMEMDEKPEEGSQYWICPTIVDYMNEKLDRGLLEYIQENEKNGMRFLKEYY